MYPDDNSGRNLSLSSSCYSYKIRERYSSLKFYSHILYYFNMQVNYTIYGINKFETVKQPKKNQKSNVSKKPILLICIYATEK